MPDGASSAGYAPVMRDYKILAAGDTAIVVEFGDRIDRQLNARVLALARRVDQIQMEGVVETVPTFRSLTVHYDPLVLPPATLRRHIDAHDARLAGNGKTSGVRGACRSATTPLSPPISARLRPAPASRPSN